MEYLDLVNYLVNDMQTTCDNIHIEEGSEGQFTLNDDDRVVVVVESFKDAKLIQLEIFLRSM